MSESQRIKAFRIAKEKDRRESELRGLLRAQKVISDPTWRAIIKVAYRGLVSLYKEETPLLYRRF